MVDTSAAHPLAIEFVETGGDVATGEALVAKWAESQGLISLYRGRSRRWLLPPSGQPIIWCYPDRKHFELDLEPLSKETAGALRSVLADLQQGPSIDGPYPTLRWSTVVSKWNVMENQLLPEYLTQYEHLEEQREDGSSSELLALAVETAESSPRDFEDDAPSLIEDEADDDPVDFWERKQRDLVTSVLDYNLETLSSLIQSGKIDLSPEYQRRGRWNADRQSKLIESFLMNVPVPPIFLNEDEYGQYSVIDGKQRLTGIHEFMRGRLRLRGLKVFGEINGRNIDDLPPSLQSVIQTRANVRAVIILRQSDQDVKFLVFQRLNTGGVKLNPQEIRNSTWPGPLNNMILELSTDPTFHDVLGISDRKRSAIFREMRDAEFVLRYFTFRDSWETFSGGMARQMDTYMVENQRTSEAGLAERKEDFLATLGVVKAAFGEHAFQRWMPERDLWRRQVVAALYDAQMFACRGLDAAVVGTHRDAILNRTRELFDDDDFRKAVDAATNTPALFRTRIRKVKELLRTVLPVT